MSDFYNKAYPAPLVYPLTAIPPVVAGTKLHSPCPGDSHGVPAPAMPGEPGFECELLEVVCVRGDVLKGKWPSAFLKKYHPRADFNPDVIPLPIKHIMPGPVPSIAVTVIGSDIPVDLVNYCIKWLNSQNAKLRNPTTNHVDFLNRMVDVYARAAEQVRLNFETVWDIKWFYGRIRPEEAVANCGMNGVDMTGYTTGSPNHPSFPAGHAGSAAAVTVLFDHYDLTTEQYNQVYDAAYHWAMYRTLAGVHYATDNIWGLRSCGFPI